VKNIDHFLDLNIELLSLNIEVIFSFNFSNLPKITCPDIPINYSVVVLLPQGHGILHNETGNPQEYILFQ